MGTARYCSVCATARAFELLPCSDGHGSDCPELICVECGYVVIVGVVEELLDGEPAFARSVA